MIEKTNIKIGYMYNPDKVYYNEMDDYIVKRLIENDCDVIKLRIEEINFCIKNGEIEVYKNKEKIHIDGYLSYGYMSKFHFEAYLYIIQTFYAIGIPCLHSPEEEKILNNKYLQSLRFYNMNVPIPMTSIGFSVESFKNMANNFFPEQSINKKLDDYGGDGVTHHLNKEGLINQAAKTIWKNELSLFQEFIKDSLGQSIRVLCINGKAVACAKYLDKTNNFKSNSSYGTDFFSLESLMENPKLNEYCMLAEKAVASIGSLTIGGVDILDSKEKGTVVLEINGWPDIYDISETTKIDIFKLFTEAYINKVRQVKEMKNKYK